MKKLTVTIGISLVLILLFFAIGKKQNSSPEYNDKQYIIDTAKITKIVIQHEQNTLTLTKDRNNWYIDNFLPAEADKVNSLLYCLHNMKIREKVSDNVLVSVREQLEKSQKIELYDKGKLYKSFFISKMLPDSSGYYFMESGDLLPYIVYVPNAKTCFNPLLSVNLSDWLDKEFFNHAKATKSIDSVLAGKSKLYIQDIITDPLFIDSLQTLAGSGSYSAKIITVKPKKYQIYIFPGTADSALYTAFLSDGEHNAALLLKVEK